MASDGAVARLGGSTPGPRAGTALEASELPQGLLAAALALSASLLADTTWIHSYIALYTQAPMNT